MDPVLNEQFKELTKELQELNESKKGDPMPKITYDAIHGKKGSTTPSRYTDSQIVKRTDSETQNNVTTDKAPKQKIEKVMKPGEEPDRNGPYNTTDTAHNAGDDAPKNTSTGGTNEMNAPTNLSPSLAYGTKMFKSSYEPGKAKLPVGEECGNLFSETDLTDDFKEKATILFEAKINEKLVSVSEEIKKELEEQFTKEFKIQTEQFKNEVDSTVNYGISQWIQENKVEVSSHIRNQLNEDFIIGLKKLFEDHSIIMPETKEQDVIQEMAAKIEALEEKYEKEVEKNIKLKDENDKEKKKDIAKKVGESAELTDVDKEKLVNLAYGCSYSGPEEFEKKVNVLKETYFKKPTQMISEANSLQESEPISEEAQKPVELKENARVDADVVMRHLRF